MQFTSVKNLTRSSPEIGRIKIGSLGETRQSRSGGTFRLPRKLDHFEVVTRFRGPDGTFTRDEDIHAAIGDKPTELPVLLMYDDPALNFPHRMTCWDGQREYCRGNGEQAERLDGGTGTYQPRQCPCPLFSRNPEIAPENKGRDKNNLLKCRYYGILRVHLPQKPNSVGCYAHRTRSTETVRNIVTFLEDLLVRTDGVAAGIPLTLRMYQATDNTPGGPSVSWKVMLDLPDGGWDAVNEAARRVVERRLATRTDMKAIEARHRKELETLLSDPGDEREILAELFPPDPAPAEGATLETAPPAPEAQAEATPSSEPPSVPAPQAEQESPPPAPSPEPPVSPPPVASEPAPAPAPAPAPPAETPKRTAPPSPAGGNGNAPDPDEVAYAETDDPIEHQAILTRLALRKAFNLNKLTKPLVTMTGKERKDLLKHLLSLANRKK